MTRQAHKFGSNALKVLKERYLESDETPEQRFWDMSMAINPERAEEYYNLMISKDFLPNSPTIMNAGRGTGQLSACFVVPVNDSMHDILMAAYDVGMVQKTGGGTGFTLSRLRPRGAGVSSTRGVSSGPISFLRMYNAVTDTIEQGGTRRGANMATMRIDHPDIVEFIKCKSVEGVLKNFNISVMLTDFFMEAFRDNTDISLTFGGKFYQTLPARELFDLVATHAWKNGEPGVLFIDTINKAHPIGLGEIDATNPCGEQPLLDHESCNLGSINLANMLDRDSDGELYIDTEKLQSTTRLATAFLDDVISATKFPLPQIEEATLRTRKIGLGVMGWGEVLVKLRIPYDSEKALSLAESVMRTISNAANRESLERGKLLGPYPAWDESQGPAYRNATRTTIAPTGSLATIAGTSWSIEPLFGLSFTKSMVDMQFTFVDESFMEWLENQMIAKSTYTRILKEVKKTGSCQHIEEVPKNIRDVFKTAQDISYESHIRMQAAFQKYTDNAVSKTINFPNSATKSDFEKAILLAYKLGCKGLTMYRAGTRKEEAVSVGTEQKGEKGRPTLNKPAKRPKRVYGFTEQCQTGCGKLYVTVNSNKVEHPIEVFIEPGSDGGCEAYGKALSRVISLGLRAGVDPDEYVRQLRKVSCKNFLRKAANGNLVGKSCPDVVGRILQSAIEDDIAPQEATVDVYSGDGTLVAQLAAPEKGPEEKDEVPCPNPNCNGTITAAEGCWVCSECGYNECNG